MRYASIRSMDISNGEGVGVSLFVQGCHHHCKKCFNSETWDFNGGKEWTQEVEDKFLKLVSQPFVTRVSFLGGSPLAEENVNTVLKIIKRVRVEYPDKKIWLWTGYTYNHLIYYKDLDDIYKARFEVLNNIDFLVDGQYIDELKNPSLVFRGSTNQNIWTKQNDGWVKIDE